MTYVGLVFADSPPRPSFERTIALELIPGYRRHQNTALKRARQRNEYARLSVKFKIFGASRDCLLNLEPGQYFWQTDAG